MQKVNGAKYTISNYALFAKEFIKRKVLWDRNASFPEKTEALYSMGEALDVDITPRPLYICCNRFKKTHEKKVYSYLMYCIKKQLTPELALKRKLVPAWVREVDAELKVLPRLIEQFRAKGLLQPKNKTQEMWASFVDKMVAHCHSVRRLPTREDIAAVVDELGLQKNKFELLERLWQRQTKNSLYKYRCLTEMGDKPYDSITPTLLEWKIIDLMALYMDGFSVIYDCTLRECDFDEGKRKIKGNYRLEELHTAIDKVLNEGMGIKDASILYSIPKSTLAGKINLLKRGEELYKSTFKSNVQVKQLVKLYHLVKTFRIEDNDPDDITKQKWAMLVKNYSSNEETSPSGIILQLRWHELKAVTHKSIHRRIQDKDYKVHPLLVEIATKYPYVVKYTMAWNEKVMSGKVYDVSNVPINWDYYYSHEEESDETGPSNEQVLDKNAEADSDFDSDDERPLVIADDSTPVATTSKKRTKSMEKSMPRLYVDDEEPKITMHDAKNVNSAVGNVRNEELVRLDDELRCTQLRSLLLSNNSQAVNPVTDKINKNIDILDEELEKLSIEFNKQFNELKNLCLATNDSSYDDCDDGNKDVAFKTKSKSDESNSELSKDNQTSNSITAQSNEAGDIKQCGTRKSCNATAMKNKYSESSNDNQENKTDMENNAKFATKIYKRKKDEVNTSPGTKSELPNDNLSSDGIIATVYACKAPDGSELGHVVVPTPISKDSVTLTLKMNDGVIKMNSTVVNDPPADNIHVSNDNKTLNTSKESDLDLLQKIDPTQAETILIFSDSDNEESNLPNENAQDDKKAYNLNDVKKYLSNHSLDDILLKMDGVGLKRKLNRRSATYISLSDSDEESKNRAADVEIINIDNDDVNITNEGNSSLQDNVVSSIPNENSSLLIPNLNVPNTNMIAFNVKAPNTINAEDMQVTVKVERDDDSDNETRSNKSSKEVLKKTTHAVEKSDALPTGLNLFKLQDRASKETLGVLVNVKNSIKSSELGAQVSKKVGEYLNDSTDINKSGNDNNEYYDIINKTIENVSKGSTVVLLKKFLDSSSTKTLGMSDQEKSNEENNDEDSRQASIDPKLIMDTRVYLPKLDEVKTYNKNRRVDFSINVKRISKSGQKMLDYKRKSDDPTRVHNDIESEISEVPKRKVTDLSDNIEAKRIRKCSDDKSLTTPHNTNSVRNEIKSQRIDEYRKPVSSDRANIVQRIVFEADDDLFDNDLQRRNNTLEKQENIENKINNVNVKIENIQNTDTSMNEHDIDVPEMLPEKDITMTSNDDNVNSGYGSDAMELDDTIQNNTLLLDSSNKHGDNLQETEYNYIRSENISSSHESINEKNKGGSNNNKTISDRQDLTENMIAHNTNNQLHVNLNETSNRPTVTVKNKDEIKETNVENDPYITEKDNSSNDDTYLKIWKTLKESSIKASESVKIEHIDDNDSTPINNIAEMLKLCKPVKLCLKRVKVPSEHIQVRKVELPDRSSLKRHRAPTAHVAPISVCLPLDEETDDGEASEAQLGSLLNQLSMETASEWHRLEESVKAKRSKIQDHVFNKDKKEKEKCSSKKEEKRRKKIISKPKTPEPDELRSQNLEWERQKTMNNRFFDLTPKYQRSTVNPSKDKKNIDNREKTLSKKPVQKDIPPSETDVAVASLMNEVNKDSNTNNDIVTKSVENHDTFNVITISCMYPFPETAERKQSNPVSSPPPLVPLRKPDSVNKNVLTPLFTKVKKKLNEKKKELVPIATEVNSNTLSTPKVRMKIPEAKGNEQKLRILPDRSKRGMHMTDKKGTVRVTDKEPTPVFQVLPSTSKGVSSKSLLKPSNIANWHYISEDPGPSFEFETVVQKDDIETTDDESPSVDVQFINDAKRKQTPKKKTSQTQKIKRKTKDPVETITLSDSDTDIPSQPDNANVEIDKSKNQDEQRLTNVNPPIKIMESTINKTGSKYVLKTMDIGPINSNVLKKIDKLLNDSSKRVVGPQITNVSSIIDLDDSSDECKDDKNHHNLDSIASEFSESPPENQDNIIIGQMPQITSVTSIGSSIDIDIGSKKDSETIAKPINSDDEYYESDSDELHIVENPINSNEGEINVQTKSNLSTSTEPESSELKIVEVKSLSLLKNNIKTTTNIKLSNIPIKPKAGVIKSTEAHKINKEPSVPPLSNTGRNIAEVKSLLSLKNNIRTTSNIKLTNVPKESKTGVIKITEAYKIDNEPSIPPLSNTGSNNSIQDNIHDSTHTNIPSVDHTDENITSDINSENLNSGCGDNSRINENNCNSTKDSIPNIDHVDENVPSDNSNDNLNSDCKDNSKIDENNCNSTKDSIHNIDDKDENVPFDNRNDNLNSGCDEHSKIDENNCDIIKDFIPNIDHKDENVHSDNTNDNLNSVCNENSKIDENNCNSTNNFIPSIDRKYKNVTPDNDNDNLNSDCNDNSKIDENNSDSTKDSIPNIDHEGENIPSDINSENLNSDCGDNSRIDKNNCDSTKDSIPNIDHKDENIPPDNEIDNLNSKCGDISRIDENNSNITEDYKSDENICSNDPIIDEKDGSNEDNEITEANDPKITEDGTNIESEINPDQMTTDNKKAESIGDKKDEKSDNDTKPRSFLKLVPIQKLLDESKMTVEPNVTDLPNIIEEEKSDESSPQGDFNTQESKMRGEPIPFLCSTKSDVTENSNLPTISNVMSLSTAIKEPLLQITINSEISDFATAKNLIMANLSNPATQSNNKFFVDNPTSSSVERLLPADIACCPPRTVADYIKDRDCTDISLLCVDESRPVWKVYKDYLIITNLKLPLVEPTYWSMGGRAYCSKIIMDPSAEGSTVVGELSMPDELFLDNHWYRKLNADPMIYAKIWYVVPNAKTCQEMINLGMEMHLYSKNTGAMTPMRVMKGKPKIVVQKTVIKFLPVGDKTKSSDSGEVISLDSDDE